MNNNITLYKRKTGFMLLEMLLVVAILGILFAGGIRSYQTFKQKQMVLNAVEDIKTKIHSARSKANSGQLGSCDKLEGYYLKIDQSESKEISLNSYCDSGGGSYELGDEKKFDLPESIKIDPTISVEFMFKVLNQGVFIMDSIPTNDGNRLNPDQDITISYGDSNKYKYTFTVYASGAVSEGKFD